MCAMRKFQFSISFLCLFALALATSACDDDSGGGSPKADASVDDASADDATVTDDAGGGGGDGCDGLCTGAGFASGEEFDFDPVFECMCDGDGDGIEQADCNAYCAGFGVDADNSYLSTETTTNDKCVCDGT
jgi:hypothetical protein